jgi:phage FluMu protein Com
MRPCTKEDLDRAGCSNPLCDHADHSELNLHGKCHPHQSQHVEYQGSMLRVSCRKCRRLIVDIETSGPRQTTDPPCHPGNAVQVKYRRGAGHLEITCAECDSMVSTIQPFSAALN